MLVTVEETCSNSSISSPDTSASSSVALIYVVGNVCPFSVTTLVGRNPVPVIVIVNVLPSVGNVSGDTPSIRGVGFGIRINVTSFDPKFATTASCSLWSTSTPNGALPTGTFATTSSSTTSMIDAVDSAPSSVPCVTPLLVTTTCPVFRYTATPVGAVPTSIVSTTTPRSRSITLTVLLFAFVTNANPSPESIATPRGKPPTPIVPVTASVSRSITLTPCCSRGSPPPPRPVPGRSPPPPVCLLPRSSPSPSGYPDPLPIRSRPLR